MIAILARSNHPPGWGGFGESGTDVKGIPAHGYVVLIVKCVDWTEVYAVRDFINANKVVGIFGSDWWDTWYGGRFDLVAVLPTVYGVPAKRDGSPFTDAGMSIGDNRYVGIVTAQQLMEGEIAS